MQLLLRPALLLILVLTTLSGPVAPSIAHQEFITSAEQSFPPAAAAPVDFRPLSRLTGRDVMGLAISGNYAYAGYGTGLTVLDISNPSQIRQVGFVMTQGIIFDVAVAGRYAAVAVQNYGVRIVDISNPTAPVMVGALPMWAEKVEFVENYLYVSGKTGAYDELLVVDLANPAAPQIIHKLSLPLGHLAVHGSSVYLAFDGAGVHIIDASNPAVPRLVSTYMMDTPGQFWDMTAVTADDRYVYLSFAPPPPCCPDLTGLTLPEASGLLVIDVADPAAPRQVGYISLAEARSMAIVGNTLYVAADRLWIVDVSTPTAPTIAGSVGVSAAWMAKFRVEGAHAYLASGHTIHAFDITMPTTPALLGAYQGFPDMMNAVAITGGYAYIATDSALRIVDLSDPGRPALVGSLAESFQGVVVQGRYAYTKVPDITGAPELWVIDIGNPAKPTRVGRLAGVGGKYQLQGQYLYALSDQTLVVVDVSSPTAPQKRAELAGVYNLSLDFAVAGRYLYVAAGPIVDIANPAAPALVGTLPRSGSAIAIAGKYAYVGGSNLSVLDITNPVAAKVVGTLAVSAIHIAVAGDYVYVIGLNRYSDAVMEVVDVSNPAAPRAVGQYGRIAYNCYPGVVLAGQETYLSCTELQILRDTGLAISGQLRYANGTPALIGNVPITSSDGRVSYSDVNGSYTFKNLASGSYTLTTTLNGYTVWPSSRDVLLPPDSRGQDFTILPAPVSATAGSGTATTLILTDTQDLPTRLSVPTAALTQSTTLTLAPRIEAGQLGQFFTGHALELSARRGNQALPGLAFGTPVQLTISYSAAEVLATSDESKLELLWWNGTTWQDAAETCNPASSYQRNLVGNTLTVPICRTGRFALFAPTNQTLLPLSLRGA